MEFPNEHYSSLGAYRRKTKNTMHWYHKHAGVGKYVVDCRYHPCIVTEATFCLRDPHGADCTTKSLITGTTSCCSYFHCGITVIDSKEEAEAMAELAKKDWWDYMFKYHYQPDTPEAREAAKKMYEEYGFETNVPRT